MRTEASPLARSTLLLAVFSGLLFAAGTAPAITITYVNPGPLDSRVFVGFANDASGSTTNDLVADPAAYSRNDTLYGPLPPSGQLPSFDAVAYGAAELGTNLSAPLGAGVRSVFTPFNVGFFQAHGMTLASTGSYSSNAFAFSGDTTATAPMHWIVHVDPSGAEVAGTPADVTVTADIDGYVSVAGASIADASWSVAMTTFGTVMSGAASQSTAGTTNFSDSGSITFSVPLGGTFELTVDYDLSTSGSGPGADSTSEITQSLVEISAVIPPPMAMFTAVSGAKLLMIDKYAASGKAKVLLLAQDETPGSIVKGPSADPAGLSGTLVLFQESNPANRAVFDLAGSGWVKNKDSAAKYSNSCAAAGQPGARSATIKPDRLLKVVARNLGDGDAATGDQNADDIDLSVLTSADVIKAVFTVYNANDSSTHTMCAQFESPQIKAIAGGSGVKYLSKTSSLPTTCPECGNGIAEPGEECLNP